MPELSIDLQKLQPLKGAFDIILYLSEQGVPADTDTICDDLDMSDRRFGKAIKRLVTTGYVQMNLDYEYYLTDKGEESAEELEAFYGAGGSSRDVNENKVVRRLLLALPRQLTAGQTTDMHIGFEADDSSSLSSPADVVLRVSAIHALLSGGDDTMMQLGNDLTKQVVQLTPEMYEQVRVKVQVFQLAPNGEDITMCGGMYIDVNVDTTGDQNSLVAYATEVALDPT